MIRRGENSDKIYFLKFGKIKVEIPQSKRKRLFFDKLTDGACFCLYSSLHDNSVSNFQLRTKTECSLETIRVADLFRLELTNLDLADEIKELRSKINEFERN